jgi:murein L,D-transpeptidase YafK
MYKTTSAYLLGFIFLCFVAGTVAAQDTYLPLKRTSFRMAGALGVREDSLRKEFNAKGLEWPAKYVFIRSFKYDGQLEIWVKNAAAEKYKLFKTYKVCLQSGSLGPKRIQGDYQVPEGFYYINEFNPNSAYHLALGLNYPNTSDKILSDPSRPGNGIYIHGSCVSVGCIPVTNEDIEEIYIIASAAKANGEDFIPVHIFPVRYNKKSSMDFFDNYVKANPSLQKFSMQLKSAFDKFETTHELPIILIDTRGDYVVD